MSRWPKVDASHDLRAEEFGRQVIENIPQNAIVFANGDRAIFALWYFHFALKQRSDIAIQVPDLLQADWYANTIHTNYPLIHWPKGIFWSQTIAAANQSRAIRYVSYLSEEQISCDREP